MRKHNKEDYYHIIHDIKRIELLKKAGFLSDKITLEKALSIVLRVILNLLNDYFSKLNDNYGVPIDSYYEFLNEFKNQVNVILNESQFNDIGIIEDVKDKKSIRRPVNKNKK